MIQKGGVMVKPRSLSALAAFSLEVVAGVAFFTMFAASASADVIIDPQIYVQQTTVGNAPNGSNLIGGGGKAITHPPGVNVGGAGDDNPQKPLFVIVSSYKGDKTGFLGNSYTRCPTPHPCPHSSP